MYTQATKTIVSATILSIFLLTGCFEETERTGMVGGDITLTIKYKDKSEKDRNGDGNPYNDPSPAGSPLPKVIVEFATKLQCWQSQVGGSIRPAKFRSKPIDIGSHDKDLAHGRSVKKTFSVDYSSLTIVEGGSCNGPIDEVEAKRVICEARDEDDKILVNIKLKGHSNRWAMLPVSWEFNC